MSDKPISESAVREALSSFKDPETGRGIVQLGQLHNLQLKGNDLSIVLGLTSWSLPLRDEIVKELSDLLKQKFPGLNVTVNIENHDRKPVALGEMGLKIKSVIAVGAGKGGVGKSSVAAYLAYGLAKSGAKVALLDADVYGPSIPHLFGANQHATIIGEKIQPVVVDGLKLMSIGFLVPPGEAIIWRGPMLHSMLTQFLRDTDWGELDYLIIDMPPGTGDIPLSLSQLVPLTGAVVVGTPQEVALIDVVKAVKMLRQVNIDVLGMVENMSFFICSKCNAEHDIFGTGGAKKAAAELGVPFLGALPLISELRVLADQGQIGKAFDNPAVKAYLESICLNLVRNLAKKHQANPQMPKLNILS